MSEATALPCIVCARVLPSAYPPFADRANQPMGGTSFHTSGHYGSGVFDSIDGSEVMEISVCDTCLRNRERDFTVIRKRGAA